MVIKLFRVRRAGRPSPETASQQAAQDAVGRALNPLPDVDPRQTASRPEKSFETQWRGKVTSAFPCSDGPQISDVVIGLSAGTDADLQYTSLDGCLDEPWAETLARHLGHGQTGEEADLRLGRRFSVARRLAGLFDASCSVGSLT